VSTVISTLRTAPVSYGQRLLWLLDRRAGAEGAGELNERLAWRIRGPLEIAALRGALDTLEARHEVLRTSFGAAGRSLVQTIHPPSGVALEVADADAESGDAAPAELVDAAAGARIDPAGAPLRAFLWRLAPHDHVLALVLHQLITDPRSSALLAEELGIAYDRGRGSARELPATAWQYADWCEWQSSSLAGMALRELQRSWRAELDGASFVALPAGPGEGAPGEKRYERRMLGSAAADGVRRLAQAERATPLAVALAAFWATLHEATGQRDLAIASLFANRRPEVERTLGLFVNMVVLRGRISPRATLAELVRSTAGMLESADRRAALPFHMLAPNLLGGAARGGARAEDVVFQFLEGEPRASALARMHGLELAPIERQPRRARFALEVFVALMPDALAPVVLYDAGRIPGAWARSLTDRYVERLAAL
jgi:hypothetical protein